jgi:hypothetical protein
LAPSVQQICCDLLHRRFPPVHFDRGEFGATRVLRVDPAGERVAMVTTGDDLLDAEGRIIARWKHVYLLRETADGLRAIAAVADDEISAWTAKGTPLGR